MMIPLTQKRLHLDKPPAVILRLLCAGGGLVTGTWPVALGVRLTGRRPAAHRRRSLRAITLLSRIALCNS